jgi:NodT family efflux transporter outer membrane factor (OMF) lipoprotein
MKTRITTILLLTACLAFGADTPNRDVPSQFYQQKGAAGTSTDPTVDRWWVTLQDAELNSIIERAAKANLDLKVAASRVLEARAVRRIARAGLLPSIESSNSLQRVRGGLTQGIFHVNNNQNGVSNLLAPFETNIFQFGFDANWEIDFFGGRRHALQAATADVLATDAERRDTLVTLLAEVARGYVELRGYQRRLALTEDNIRLQEDSMHLTQVRAQAGLGTELDVERQSAQLETTRALIPQFRAAEMQAIHGLSVLLGEPPESLLQELVRTQPIPATPPNVPVGLPADLLKRRPDVRRSESAVTAAAARLGEARAELFPKIVLTGAMGRQSTQLSQITVGAGNFFAIGPNITLPIFTSGRIRSNIEAQRQQLNQAISTYQLTVLTSLRETEDSLVAYGQEKERRGRLLAAVEASKRATRLADELYVRGLSDFLSVLDAQRQQLQAEDDLAQSDTVVITNLVAVYKALGGGWQVSP